jgi:hypothetical protein
MMTALNYPVSPEALNFRAGVWQGIDQNSRSVSLTGFTLDVGNLKFQNGLIVGTTPLAAAAFASRSFNSFGRLYDVDMEDGGHGAHTADPHVAIDFLTAVWAGDFEVAFAAKNIPLERTYHISSAPSADVIRQFKDCLGTL